MLIIIIKINRCRTHKCRLLKILPSFISGNMRISKVRRMISERRVLYLKSSRGILREPTTWIGCVMETNSGSIDMRAYAYISHERHVKGNSKGKRER